MTRSQRRLIAFGLPVIAVILHTTHCEWLIDRPYRASTIVAYDHSGVSAAGSRVRRPIPDPRTGLVAQSGVHLEAAVFLGVVTPLLLLGLDAYLILGWRHAARRAAGLCAECGYDLRRTQADATTNRDATAARSRPDVMAAPRCPECGCAAAV